MEDLYIGKIVDITDPYCEFVAEFNKEIKKYGAIAYNYDTNSYQFIRKFSHIDVKREIFPDFLKIEKTNALLNGMEITVHYEFDPETEEDPENLDIWEKDISTIELPVFKYDDDGEIAVDKYNKFTTTPTKHVIWFLSKESSDCILDTDILLLTPVIKNLEIARELIKKYGINPFDFKYDPADMDGYEIPELYGVYQALSEEMDQESQIMMNEYDDYFENRPDEDDESECQCNGDCPDCDGSGKCHNN